MAQIYKCEDCAISDTIVDCQRCRARWPLRDGHFSSNTYGALCKDCVLVVAFEAE